MTGNRETPGTRFTSQIRRFLLMAALVVIAAVTPGLYGCGGDDDADGDGGASGQSFGGGSWPPGSWRPYSAASPFNQVIPPRPPLADNWEQIRDRVFGFAAPEKRISIEDKPNNLVAPLDGAGGEPTYWSRASDPEYRLHCRNDFYGRTDCPIEGKKIRIPKGARPEQGPDRHLTVVDQGVTEPGTNWEYDLWEVEESPDVLDSGGDLYFQWGGRTDLNGLGTTERGGGVHLGNSTASYFGGLAGRLRAEELKSGVIDHALNITIACDSGEWVYPALGKGRPCGDVLNAPPMGSRFQLAMDETAIDQLGLPASQTTILKAMAKYGMFFGDTGSKGYFSIEAEAGLQYLSLGHPDEWRRLAEQGGQGWDAGENNAFVLRLYGPGVDWPAIWRNIRVIHECVSKRTCVVPDVTELTFGPAGSQIKAAGYVAQFTGSTEPRSWVRSQSPQGGTYAGFGSVVTLQLARPPAP